MIVGMKKRKANKDRDNSCMVFWKYASLLGMDYCNDYYYYFN